MNDFSMHSLTLRYASVFCYVQIVVSWVVTLCGLVNVYKFWMNRIGIIHQLGMKLEEESSPETLVTPCQTARCQIPEDGNLHCHLPKNLESNTDTAKPIGAIL